MQAKVMWIKILLFIALAGISLFRIPAPVQADGDLLVITDNCESVHVNFRLDESEDPERTFIIQVVDGGRVLGSTTFRGDVGVHDVLIPYSAYPEQSTIEVTINHDLNTAPDSVMSFETGCLRGPETSNGSNRVVGNVNFVVFYIPEDGRLEYYEVVNSQGIYLGMTPAGWHNGSLGGVLVHSFSQGDAQVQLWNLGGDVYKAILYKNGANISEGVFGGIGPAGSGVIGNTAPVVQTTTSTTTAVPSTTGTDSNLHTNANGSFDGTYYTVVAGDTLFGIARRFNVDMAVLQSVNGIANINWIYVGQRLRIP